MVGDTFRLLKDVIGEYISFVRGLDAALKLHDKLLRSSNKYAKAMEECSESEAAKGLLLGAYLILPIQRFPRYELLIRDMLRHTSQTHHDYELLNRAMGDVKGLCEAINEATKNTEHYDLLVKIEGLTGVRLTDKPNRVLRDEVDVHENVNGKWVAQSVLLFDDLILSVIKKSTKIVDVQWKVDGNSGLLVGEAGAATFDVLEYREDNKMVRHTIRPVGSSPQSASWRETLRLSQTPLTKRDRKRLRALGTSKHYQKESIIVQTQERMTSLVEVDQGKLGSCAHLGKFVRLQMSEHNRGGLFGFECLLRDPRFPYETTCLSKTSNACFIPFDKLIETLVHDPLLAHRFWHTCCVTLAEQFHFWTLPRTIEAHFLMVSGDASKLRRTLAPVFAATEMVFRDHDRDMPIVASFGLPVDTDIVFDFEDSQLSVRGTLYTGTLYVMNSHVCFAGSVNGNNAPITLRESFPYIDCQSMVVSASDSNRLDVTCGRRKVYFLNKRTFTALVGTHDKWKRQQSLGKTQQLLGRSSSYRVAEKRMNLTPLQWEGIFAACSQTQVLGKGKVVLSEGDESNKIFLLERGKCRVESHPDVVLNGVVTKSTNIVGYMGAGELFGERSLLFGGHASASVIVHTQEAEIRVLDRLLLERLFFARPDVAGGFYRYLAFSIEGRLWQRNQNVLNKYSSLLAAQIQDGTLDKAGLRSTFRGGNAQIVRVGRPMRKESMNEISRFLPASKGEK